MDPSVSSVRLEEVRKSRSGLFRNLLKRNSYKEEAEGRIIVQIHPSNGSIEDNNSAYSSIHDRNPHFQQTIQLSFPVTVPIKVGLYNYLGIIKCNFESIFLNH